jgi:protein SCO1/2
MSDARRIVSLITPCLVFVALSCRPEATKNGRPGAAKNKDSKTETTVEYRLKGVVRGVDLESREVTIAHEAIPGFMDAMTMPFTVRDRSLLEDVRRGDEVEGTLEVKRRHGEVADYTLKTLEVTVPAPAETISLDFSSGSPQIHKRSPKLEFGTIVPDFTVTTQDDRPLRLSDLRGEVVVLTFIYTRCPLPDYCPLVDKKFHELADKLSLIKAREKKVRLVSVSFDPEHDTPKVLAEHAARVGAKPPLWTFAVASHEELAKVAEPLGLIYGPGKDEIIHNLCVAIIDSRGRLVRLDTGIAAKKWNPSEYFRIISSLVAPSSK